MSPSRPQLPEDYSIREMSDEEFRPLWQKHAKEVFADTLIFRSNQVLSAEEKERLERLGENLGTPYRLRLGLFSREEFVGWHIGYQKDGETFYMQNSAVLPAHRRQGLYRALLAETLTRLRGKGFQLIYSRHNMTNNDVIIPKLQAGFVITGLEQSDVFGTLVHLTYFTNPLRRKMMEFRSGNLRPDEELRRQLGL